MTIHHIYETNNSIEYVLAYLLPKIVTQVIWTRLLFFSTPQLTCIYKENAPIVLWSV